MNQPSSPDPVPGPLLDGDPGPASPLTEVLRDGVGRRDRSVAAVATSTALHLSMAGAVLYASAFAVVPPPPRRTIPITFVAPPVGPPPPAAPKGLPRPASRPPEAKPRPPMRQPVPRELVVPQESVAPSEAVEVPEGLPNGSDNGIIGGSEFGMEGGDFGGVDDGVLGAPPTDLVSEIVPTSFSDARLISKVEPVYPLVPRKAGMEGIVILEAIIDTDGSVSDVTVLRGSPHFDGAAMDAVRQWRFEPGSRNGRPVKMRLTVSVNFRIHR